MWPFKKPIEKAASTEGIGVSGLEVNDGVIEEEPLKLLDDFEKRQKKFKEMADNDWACGAMLWAIKILVLQAKWSVVPFSEDKKHREDAKWLEDVALKQINQPFYQIMNNILIMNYAGFMFLEKVYKRLDDGKITWAKLAPRKPSTVYKWNFDDNGELTGIVQQDPNTMDLIDIPIEKLLLFRPDMELNNPEGRSLLRTAFEPYFRKGKYKFYEGVGWERNAAGFPSFEVPRSLLDDNASAEEKKLLTTIKDIGRNIRVDHQSCLVLPSDVYEGTNIKQFSFKFESSNTTGIKDLSEAIKRLDRETLSTILADFIMLGQEAVGSYALSSDKTSIFAMSVGSILGGIKSEFNENAIPELFRLNGDDSGEYPTLEHSDIESEDIAKWAEGVSKLTMSGHLTPDLSTEREVRRKMGFDNIDEEAYSNFGTSETPGEPNPEDIEPDDDDKEPKPEDVE